MAGTLSGFDPAAFRDAIHLVQEMAAPNATTDRATFYFAKGYDETVVRDVEWVPFDPNVEVGGTEVKRAVRVPVAVRYVDRDGQLENLGTIIQSKLVLTLLDVDYIKVKGFVYMTIGGERYDYHHTEPPVGLGSVTIHNVHVTAVDEA